jgi:hypothetical protein
VLSTVLIGIGSSRSAGVAASPDINAYHFAFLTAACFALVGAGFSLTIHDSDAAETIVRRSPRRRTRTRTPEPAHIHERVA